MCLECQALPEPTIEDLKINGRRLTDVKNQTDELCLAAVSQCGRALLYVKEQTDDICLAAVKQDGLSLRCVIYHTPEICLAAAKHSKYRTWQINRPFVLNNDVSKIDLTGEQKNILLNNSKILNVYPNIKSIL